MGIIGKLFDKKVCDICGGDIGLLGNRKLEDGNLCKECAAKLSPWMTDRRQSTVEEIRKHLAYRAANAQMLRTVNPTVAVGGSTKVYIDQAAKKFFVTRFTNWRDHNPDIIDFSQVLDVKTEVNEHREEQYHNDREGKRVSYDPPRYTYSYEFDTTILVNSPFFSEIKFELTDKRPDDRRGEDFAKYEKLAKALHDVLTQAPKKEEPTAKSIFSTVVDAVQAAAAKAAEESANWKCACGAVNNGKFCTNCGAKKPEPPKKYRCSKCGWVPDDPTKPPRFCPQCGDPFTQGDAV